LVITNGKNQYDREVVINGYTYPYIKDEVLFSALPYLTNITPFSYGFNLDGTLIELNDEKLIEIAIKNNVAPLMLLTTINADGTFNSVKASMMLKDESIQDTLIKNIIKTLQDKNYAGIDVDFEYLSKDDRDNFTNFIKKLTEALHPLGYEVTIALAAKESEDEVGLLFEGHDYKALGQYADNLLLMTYEWGYAYSPPMPVAPIYNVRGVLDYAITQIDNEKLLIGIPNYGYDWTLPHVEGTAAKSINNVAAVDLARNMGAVIEYDETAQSPFFTYYDVDGKEHMVWFEDARSIEAKLKLIDEYDIKGAAYWTIMSKFPQNWLVLRSMYDIKKV
jgi:spore germination protein